MAHFRKHVTKDGRTTYYYRGKVPVRLATGEVVYREVERSTRAGTLAEARKKAREIEAEYHERAGRPVPEGGELTFADAATSYMKSGGERRFLAPILARIGELSLTEIAQDVVQQVADELVPGGNPSTVNRHVFTPILAVLNYGHRVGMCPPPALIRPKGHDSRKPLQLPDDGWFKAVLPHLSPKIRACVLLITLHGLRISEAIERTPEDVDTRRWRLNVPDTKTGEPAEIDLSRPVIEAIKAIPDWKRQTWLFGTRHRSNVYRAIRAACEKAGVPYYSTHPIGRHSFSTRLLRDGKSLKGLMEAGRWKTAKMPMQRYGHLESSEVSRDVKDLADRWQEGLGGAPIERLRKVEE